MDTSGRPRLSFGNRGVLYVEVISRGANTDLHSGNFGGPVPNPAWRLVEFLSSLRNRTEPWPSRAFTTTSSPHSPREGDDGQDSFDEKKFMEKYGLKKFAPPDDLSYMEKLMFRPTLNIAGFTSGYGGAGARPFSPARRFSNGHEAGGQPDPGGYLREIRPAHEEARFRRPGSEPAQHLRPLPDIGGPSLAPKFAEAIREGFQKDAVLIPAGGGSFPGAAIRSILGIPILSVPYGNADENNHAPNENLAIDCFKGGIRTTAALFFKLAE